MQNLKCNAQATPSLSSQPFFLCVFKNRKTWASLKTRTCKAPSDSQVQTKQREFTRGSSLYSESMFQDLRKAYVYLFILSFTETVRTASFDVRGGKKVTQSMHIEEIHSKIPSKHDKKLSKTETNGFFLSLWCKFIYFVHYPSIHLWYKSMNLPQSIKAQHTYYSVDICIFNHHPALVDQQWCIL